MRNLIRNGRETIILAFNGSGEGGFASQECEHEFVTAEIQEEFLEELVNLRNALSDIKENAEAYIKESSKASRSLEKLSNALSCSWGTTNIQRCLTIDSDRRHSRGATL